MPNYPAALDDLTAVQDDHGVDAASAWFLPAAIEAVQAELGVTPSGASATVAARLDAIEGAAVTVPAEPEEITGVRDTAGLPAIVAAILTALDGLGLIDDQTTAPE